jgi:hypothetical protein
VLEVDVAAGAAGALGVAAGLASLLEEDELSLDVAGGFADSALGAESLLGLLSLSPVDFGLTLP